MAADVNLELRRDLMHSLGLVIPVAYCLLPKETVLLGMIPIVVVYGGCDLLRLYHKGFRRFFYRFIGNRLLKPREERNLIGSTYFLIGAVLTILLYDKGAAIPALFIVVLADIAASEVGSRWGRHEIFDEKTLEGALAFFLTALAIVSLFYPGPKGWGVGAAFAAAVVETVPLRLDDNLTVSLVAGFVLQMGI
ncbi:MAG: hypothetical protein DRG33_01065 [Deltaproteobacteria bacterium]|nr:MAG: hypothetical protein DRG33_01065 [Deltaproteobacteria bacterium]HEX16403.1 hypothetical protein [Deltaproteobacteria bacterium]